MLKNVNEFLFCRPYVGIWALVVGKVHLYKGKYVRNQWHWWINWSYFPYKLKNNLPISM